MGRDPSTRCRLCLAPDCVSAGHSQGRALVHCPTCGLIFVPEAQWVSLAAERNRYAHHDNRRENRGYASFLGEVADVVAGGTLPGARVLDFGSGERGVLAQLLDERGYDCTAYDPLYELGVGALAERFDVIVLCEVIEHLRDLRGELLRLAGCLRTGGRVVVRTRCYPSLAEMATWWYARDITHINFFSPSSLDLAARLCALASTPTAKPDIFVWAPG